MNGANESHDQRRRPKFTDPDNPMLPLTVLAAQGECKPKQCPKCFGTVAAALHTCPYRAYIWQDLDFVCWCCEECREDCMFEPEAPGMRPVPDGRGPCCGD